MDEVRGKEGQDGEEEGRRSRREGRRRGKRGVKFCSSPLFTISVLLSPSCARRAQYL